MKYYLEYNSNLYKYIGPNCIDGDPFHHCGDKKFITNLFLARRLHTSFKNFHHMRSKYISHIRHELFL